MAGVLVGAKGIVLIVPSVADCPESFFVRPETWRALKHKRSNREVTPFNDFSNPICWLESKEKFPDL